MLPRLLTELLRLLRYVLDDDRRTARLCAVVLVVAVAFGMYGWVKP